MRDPYTVLGVPKSADAAEIKSAFRKLAKKFHPDQSKEPKAKEKFAEIGSAYEILGDEKKRGAFDRGEIDAEGKPRHPGFEGFGAGAGAGRRAHAGAGPGFEGFEFNFGGGRPGAGASGLEGSDIFSELFGGAAGRRGARAAPPVRGEDVQAAVTVSLNEAATGAQARVTLPSGRTLEVSVPAGIEDGKQIRLKRQGHSSLAGGEPGDAIVTVKIAKHPYFRVEGRDVRLDLPVTLYEAVLGAKINAPTLGGAVELAVPAGTTGGRTLRLRGKGLPNPNGAPGDLLVTLRVTLPDEPDAELSALMRKWESGKPYNPRGDLG
ncbi:MAG: DnaJ C-terminal domain-containing protein [Methylocella sp.]